MLSNVSITSALASFANSALPGPAAFGPSDAERISRIKFLITGLSSPESPLRITTLSEAKCFYLDMQHGKPDFAQVGMLSKSVIETLRLIFVEVIELLSHTTDKRVSRVMDDFTHAIWPLYSRSPSLQNMGFDLQEHVDIFASATEGERHQLRSDLLARYGLRK